jgi:hypothetical protein
MLRVMKLICRMALFAFKVKVRSDLGSQVSSDPVDVYVGRVNDDVQFALLFSSRVGFLRHASSFQSRASRTYEHLANESVRHSSHGFLQPASFTII